MTSTVTSRARSSHGGNGEARSTIPVLVALVLGAAERARLQDALKGRADVVHVETTTQLVALLDAECRPVLGVIVEGTDQDGRAVADTVRELRRRSPRLTILGYCGMGPRHSAEIRALAMAGAHELIFRDVDDRGVALREALASGAQASAAELIMEEVAPLVPESLHPFVGYCLRYPQKAHTVTEVASALGLNRKTFANYSVRAATIPPTELLAWCRLLLAAHYLSCTTKTVEAIAIQLDIPSDTALRNMIKRYTGLRAQDVRAHGGLSCVLERFGARWRTSAATAAYRSMHGLDERGAALTTLNSPRTARMTLDTYDLTHNPTAARWELKQRVTGHLVAYWRTKAEATSDGTLATAIGGRGSVRIHNENGQLQEERSYPRGADPRRSRG